MEGFIIYGICIYLFGTLAAAVISFFKNSFRLANVVLFAANAIGFFASSAFLVDFPGRELIIFKTASFFNLGLSITYLSAIFLALVSGVSALVVLYGYEYLSRYRETYDVKSVQMLISVFIFGMAGVLLSTNAIGFMVFWELMSFASFFLVMADRSKESFRAALIYFVMTHLGAGAILGGFLVLGGGSPDVRLDGIALATQNISPDFLALAFLLFFFGFGSKAGLIPFHIWLPEAHPQAPTNVSALMSGLMLKIALYGFLKTVLMFSSFPSWAGVLVIILGIVSAIFGSLHAVVEKDIKKAFAYSSIENMGIIFLILGTAIYVITKNAEGEVPVMVVFLIAYGIFHAINHAVFKTGLFLSAGVVINRVHSKSLDVMGGLAKAMPLFSSLFLVIILASAALPPLGTFYGEWGFVTALISLLQIYGSELFPAAVLLSILSLFALVSGLAVFAMVKIYSMSMLGLPKTALHNSEDGNDRLFVIPLAVIGFVTIALGVFAKNILDAVAGNVGRIFFNQNGLEASVGISSLQITAITILFAALSVITYKILAGGNKKEREYHTWDCGQPIDASMEYTSTAFSAPIRFFFLPLLQRKKDIVSIPVVDTNIWIARKTFHLDVTSVWYEKLYVPVAKSILWIAEKIRLVHTGRIQYYLLLLVVTLIITLMIAL
ncbi:MAG: proton-conducting transporter membrane subunit [Parcubacteria group bacterium]